MPCETRQSYEQGWRFDWKNQAIFALKKEGKGDEYRKRISNMLRSVKNRFSVGWFVGITLLNLLGTALLGLMAFAAAWRAPFGGPSHAGVGLDGIQLILWIWATGPMVASSFGLTGDGQFVIIILWAFLLGTIGGFVMPQMIERDKGRRFVDVDVPPNKW